MKTEKIVRTLVLVVVCILVIQIFIAMSVLMLCGNPNSRVGIIATVSTFAAGIILGVFLSKLFELFTGRSFGAMYYRFYSFDKNKGLDDNDEVQDLK
ncbi:hypothetical protein [Clostridium butyricum]|uniref:hypothetical protein n=1 Tax=Clostridium butyricum TaxID=1492 RepID=UPI00374EF71B